MGTLAINAIVASAMLVVSLLGGAQTQTKPAVDAGTSVTVVGCLKKWEPAMGGRGGILNPATLEYVLTDLAPATTAAPPPPTVMQFLVKPKDTTVALSPHVNHRVEVIGLATGLAGVNSTTAPHAAPTLTVATLKMVSTECI
jgi:hypothetical protein